MKPEGARYIRLSDTLALHLAERLSVIIDKMPESKPAPRHLQVEDQFDCLGAEVNIFIETDVPQLYKTGDGPPPQEPPTWAWAFTNSEDKAGEVETIYLGFKTASDATADAFECRRSYLEGPAD